MHKIYLVNNALFIIICHFAEFEIDGFSADMCRGMVAMRDVSFTVLN